MYEEIVLPNGSTFLLGEITVSNLEDGPYQDWYSTNFENYVVDESLVKLFKKKLKRHEILLFLGTWCGDSKREVPRLLKILEAANFPKEQLRIIAVDRRKENYKKGLNGEEKGWDIKRVPTLIVLEDGKEVNRIVERPIDSLEEDLLAILTKSSYVPNYANLKKAK
jgi:thiol-disulfide isomerase/thioredoxin